LLDRLEKQLAAHEAIAGKTELPPEGISLRGRQVETIRQLFREHKNVEFRVPRVAEFLRSRGFGAGSTHKSFNASIQKTLTRLAKDGEIDKRISINVPRGRQATYISPQTFFIGPDIASHEQIRSAAQMTSRDDVSAPVNGIEVEV